MANLTDADKVLRNDVGKSIASKLDDIADAIVAQGGGAHSLGQLSDVDIDTTTLAEGQSIVYNETTQKFENGEVSTVAALWDKVKGLGVSGAITPTSTKGTFSACYQSVIGDMVIVQGVFACSKNISAGGGVAFTLPYGLKTNTNASNFLMYDNTAGVNIHIRLANNGDVTPVDSMTNHSYRFTFAYLK